METITERRSNEIEELVIELFNGIIESFEKSSKAFVAKDLKNSSQVLKDSINCFKLKSEIFDKNIYFMAKNTPLATDLRRAVMTFGICNDLYRIEQYTVTLAEYTIQNQTFEYKKKMIDYLKKINKTIIKMLKLSAKLYQENNLEIWKDINVADKVINGEYQKIKKQLRKILMENKIDSDQEAEDLIYFTVVIKYLERTGDHIKNISNQCKMIHIGF